MISRPSSWSNQPSSLYAFVMYVGGRCWRSRPTTAPPEKVVDGESDGSAPALVARRRRHFLSSSPCSPSSASSLAQGSPSCSLKSRVSCIPSPPPLHHPLPSPSSLHPHRASSLEKRKTQIRASAQGFLRTALCARPWNITET